MLMHYVFLKKKNTSTEIFHEENQSKRLVLYQIMNIVNREMFLAKV